MAPCAHERSVPASDHVHTGAGSALGDISQGQIKKAFASFVLCLGQSEV